RDRGVPAYALARGLASQPPGSARRRFGGLTAPIASGPRDRRPLLARLPASAGSRVGGSRPARGVGRSLPAAHQPAAAVRLRAAVRHELVRAARPRLAVAALPDLHPRDDGARAVVAGAAGRALRAATGTRGLRRGPARPALRLPAAGRGEGAGRGRTRGLRGG